MPPPAGQVPAQPRAMAAREGWGQGTAPAVPSLPPSVPQPQMQQPQQGRGYPQPQQWQYRQPVAQPAFPYGGGGWTPQYQQPVMAPAPQPAPFQRQGSGFTLNPNAREYQGKLVEEHEAARRALQGGFPVQQPPRVPPGLEGIGNGYSGSPMQPLQYGLGSPFQQQASPIDQSSPLTASTSETPKEAPKEKKRTYIPGFVTQKQAAPVPQEQESAPKAVQQPRKAPPKQAQQPPPQPEAQAPAPRQRPPAVREPRVSSPVESAPPRPPESILRAAAAGGQDQSAAAAAADDQYPPPPPSPRSTESVTPVCPSADLVHVWRDSPEIAVGATWHTADKGRVQLLRLQPASVSELALTDFVGRQLLAVTTSEATVEVSTKEEASDATQGRRGLVFHFKALTGDAPKVPEGVPTVALTTSGTFTPSALRKRLAAKAGSMEDAVFSDVCEIACVGAPEKWAEEAKRMLARAREESKPQRTDRELYKALFKGIGWGEAPLALQEDSLVVLASATLFAQRKEDEDAVQMLRDALGITGSDAEYEERVRDRQEKERQREEEKLKKREAEQRRMQESRRRLAVKLEALEKDKVEVPDTRAAIRAALSTPSGTADTGRQFPLSRAWKVWYKGPRGVEELPVLVDTLEQFWRVMATIPSATTLPVGDSYHLFAADGDRFITPSPSDEANRSGGKWTATIRSNSLAKKVLCLAVGASLAAPVCGVTVERTQAGCVASLWTPTRGDDACKLVPERVGSLLSAEAEGLGELTFAAHPTPEPAEAAAEEEPAKGKEPTDGDAQTAQQE
eukprot:TRINITY_DN5733_c1_g1_i1.p1 TRINITY_DN5733_c1_g1~~TRINITY_DN5733_c1_g1_i1.p1  ORF type:complete len:793 (+),score=274.68 TRINITY_DN5733_c1_g1_i1:130-2508(+)